MQELVIISGKGGTGKTSVGASLAILAGNAVVVDCDVDAADLHIILSPQVTERHEFRSGYSAVINQSRCTGCGICQEFCRFDAIYNDDKSSRRVYSIDQLSCEGCGVCVRLCSESAIDLVERISGEWMISNTRCGPMVHARLAAAAENSGKLVSLVRREAQKIAKDNNHPLIIIDGPPGIGCPVISSITGASQALVVAEPTVSGEHDLDRVLELTRHFEIPTAVCVNKWDINPDATRRIEKRANTAGARLVGRIRYDSGFVSAQIAGKAVVETETLSSEDIKAIWKALN